MKELSQTPCGRAPLLRFLQRLEFIIAHFYIESESEPRNDHNTGIKWTETASSSVIVVPPTRAESTSLITVVERSRVGPFVTGSSTS